MYKIDVNVMRQCSLPRKLLDDQWVGRAREFTQLFRRQVIKRMRSDDYRQVVNVQVLCSEPRVIQKRS